MMLSLSATLSALPVMTEHISRGRLQFTNQSASMRLINEKKRIAHLIKLLIGTGIGTDPDICLVHIDRQLD
jgi:hypothetical protein